MSARTKALTHPYQKSHIHKHSWGVFAPGTTNGCSHLRNVKKADYRSPSNFSLTMFGWSIFGFQENGFMYANPNPKLGYNTLHQNATEHGMCFTPNGGITWDTSTWFKSPYNSKSYDCRW